MTFKPRHLHTDGLSRCRVLRTYSDYHGNTSAVVFIHRGIKDLQTELVTEAVILETRNVTREGR